MVVSGVVVGGVAEAGLDAAQVVEGDENAEVDRFAALMRELPAVEPEADQVEERVMPAFGRRAVVVRGGSGRRGVQGGPQHRPAFW